MTDGKICYIEIPSVDVARSSAFYEKVFGWHVRRRGDGSVAFDDTTGQVSGTWVTGRKPSAEPGMVVHIMVRDMTATIDAVVAAGGRLVQEVGAHAPEITAQISDPDGNVWGLYQERTLAKD